MSRCLWRSEGNLGEGALAFFHVDPKDGTHCDHQAWQQAPFPDPGKRCQPVASRGEIPLLSLSDVPREKTFQ